MDVDLDILKVGRARSEPSPKADGRPFRREQDARDVYGIRRDLEHKLKESVSLSAAGKP